MHFYCRKCIVWSVPIGVWSVSNVEAGGGHSFKKRDEIVHFIWRKPREREDQRYGQKVTFNTCIKETPIEICSHLILDKFLSNKMKEKKNDIRAVIGKTVTAKKKESGSRGRKLQEEMAGGDV